MSICRARWQAIGCGMLLCFVMTMATPGCAHAQSQAQSFDDIPPGLLAQLARENIWLKLLHQEPANWSRNDSRSAIHSAEFFLDPVNGPADPEAEVRATVRALISPPHPQDPQDAHAQCRFPARKAWLQSRLGSRLQLPAVACPAWDKWRRQGHIDSISIVFATGYLGNPASYYGHTLLKFNSRSTSLTQAQTQQSTDGELRSLTLNYGAVQTQNDDPLTYMVKGVFGGYDGAFSDIDYYYHRNQYGEQELRDLWEYELDLSADEVHLVTAHAWEVLSKQYQYFFFRRNCAFRMAELVEILEGIEIIPSQRPWTIPQSTLRQAQGIRRSNGRPLLKPMRYKPSRQSRFYGSFQALRPDEASVFMSVAQTHNQLNDAPFQQLPLDGKQAVLDTLIDYYQFLADPKARAAGSDHPQYLAALGERYRLPAGARVRQQQTPAAPHDGRKPGWVQAGYLHQDRGGSFLRVRPAYYDPLDSDQGHVPHATLTMAELRLHVIRQRVRLERLDLIAVESVNPGVTGLPGDRGEAWRLKLGLEPLWPGCENCLTARVQGDIGRGRPLGLGRGLFGTIYVGGALQDNQKDSGWIVPRAGVDLVWRPAMEWGVRLTHERRWPVKARALPSHGIARVELRHALGRDWDVRVLHERASTKVGGKPVTSLGVGAYW